jgi:hypothetical protein
MTWEELKERVYFVDGSLRDIYVLDTNDEDMEKWSQYVNTNHVVEFYDSRVGQTTAAVSFHAVLQTWTENDRESVMATIRIGAITINCFFFDQSEIENDIDPKEFNSMKEHDNLLAYMKDVSKLLNKEVILTHENAKEAILIKVKGEEVWLTNKNNL